MRAVTIADGKLTWSEHPDPVPGDTELLVAVRAAGVNRADLIQRQGLYPAPPGSPPDIPGLELAGEVLAVGRRVSRFQPGDRVMALTGGGAQAELALADEGCAMPVPDGISWAEAGGFPEAFATAHDALFAIGRLQMGETVLVTGAAGGVGTAAVQVAAASGARVVASTRHDEACEPLRRLGAAVAATPDDALDHGPFDVVVELVGAASLGGALRALATGARIAVIGVGGGARLELDLLALLNRRASVAGATLRSRPVAAKGAVVGAMARAVLPALAEGRVSVPVAATVAMAEAPAAYEQFATGGKLGKIVLVHE